MQWKPHKFQLRGIETLTTQCGAGLLLDPGMGKTATTLAAFEVLRDHNHAKKMLVIAPIKPMYGTWRQEAQKWDDFKHFKFSILHGSGKQEGLSVDADIYLINPEGITWLLAQKNLPEWEVLCVDESTKFKNSNSKRFKTLRKKLPDFYYRWILTGTPTPNGLLDLFAQVYILDVGAKLGKYITHYKNKYFQSTGFGGYTFTPIRGAMEEISESIAHMVLKLDAEDHLSMPEFHKIIRPVELDVEVMQQYKEIEKEFILNLQSGTIVAENSAAAGGKCRQIANGAVYDAEKNIHFVHDKKIQALEEIVEETSGHPLFILYEFKHDLEAIMSLLGSGAVCITGVTDTKLTTIQDKFNRGEIPYLVAHGGAVHGLNIQGHCHHMVWYGITWNLEHYTQSVWRLYRQGQQAKMVLCYMLVANGTLDEKVVQVLEHKQENQDKLEKLLMEYHPNA